MRGRLFWSVLALCSALTAPNIGRAEGARSEETSTKTELLDTLSGSARAAYVRGRSRFAEGDFETALGAFAASYAEVADPRLLWNMAACQRKLGRYAKAIDLMERYLVDSPKLAPSDEQAAARFVESMQGLVGRVSLVTRPDGVTLTIDGHQVGTSPLSEPVTLDAGLHRFVFEKEGYAAVVREEILHKKEALQLAIELPLLPAALSAVPPPKREAPAAAAVPQNRTALTAVAIASGVTAVAGAVFIGVSSFEYGRLASDCAPTCAASQSQPWKSMDTAGTILVPIGAVGLVASGLWWYFGQKSVESPAQGARARGNDLRVRF